MQPTIENVTIHPLQRNESDDPRYEVEAPEGYRWIRPVEGHFFVAWTKQEIRDTLKVAALEACPADCDCK